MHGMQWTRALGARIEQPQRGYRRAVQRAPPNDFGDAQLATDVSRWRKASAKPLPRRAFSSTWRPSKAPRQTSARALRRPSGLQLATYLSARKRAQGVPFGPSAAPVVGTAHSPSPCAANVAPSIRPASKARKAGLLANVQFLDDLPVALELRAHQVVQQAAALADELQQTTPRVMVFHVGLEMLREVHDALGEKSDLDLGRARVGFVRAELADQVR